MLRFISISADKKAPATRHPAVQDFNHLCSKIRVSYIVWAGHEHDDKVHKIILPRKAGAYVNYI